MRVISGSAKGTKLISLEGNQTRPTLDRIKESLFNILQNQIMDSYVLDLFAGSGALGIEALSRGAKKVVFCDKSSQAIEVITKNLERTHFLEKSIIVKQEYKKALTRFSGQEKFDLIFIDPPYEAGIAVKAIEEILSLDLLKKEGVLVLETDQEQRELEQLKKVEVNVYDLRKYGRVRLIFLNRKG